MKTLAEITAALSKEYTKETYDLAPIKDIEGMDYIAWNDSADLANKVFGPLGWCNTLVSSTFREFTGDFWDKSQNSMVERTFRGYEAIVRVTVRALSEDGSVIEVWRDGAGFADVVPQGKKNPLDLAFKAAASDAFSRAVKQLGDYFALFLYDKPVEDQGSYSSPRSGSTGGSSGSSGQRASGDAITENQRRALSGERNGIANELLDRMTKSQASKVMDGIIKGKLSPRAAVEAAGLTWIEAAQPKDSLPLAGSRR